MENKEAKEWMYNSDTYKEILETLLSKNLQKTNSEETMASLQYKISLPLYSIRYLLDEYGEDELKKNNILKIFSPSDLFDSL